MNITYLNIVKKFFEFYDENLVCVYLKNLDILYYVNKLISQIWDQILAFRSFQKFNVGNPAKFNKEHQMILHALKSGEFHKIGQLIKINLRSGLDQIMSMANKI